MAEAKIYTSPTCPWCKKAKEWMKGKKIKFTEYDVTKNEKAKERMIHKSGQSGIPVIEIGDQIIVGYDPKSIEKALKKK